VHGLNRQHQPRNGTWTADAVAALDGLDGPDPGHEEALLSAVETAIASGHEARVVRALDLAVQGGVSSRDSRLLTLAAPFRTALEVAGRCKTLRKALAARSLQEPEAELPDSDGHRSAAPDVLRHTQGRRALIIGGDRIGKSAGRLQGALGLDQLDWQSGHNSRKVASLGERVQAGTYDLVIFVQRFLSHKVTDLLLPSVKNAPDTLVAWCERGCGLPAVERAIREATSGAPRAR
jgi:hypothetical protein